MVWFSVPATAATKSCDWPVCNETLAGLRFTVMPLLPLTTVTVAVEKCDASTSLLART